eukprot:scaffold145746_cov33-Tisochrysis_lutea.AAC.1
MAAQQLVRVSHRAGVMTLTMANPKSRNALSSTMIQTLRSHLEADCSHGIQSGARVVVLTGCNGCFSSGHDLKEIMAARQDEQALARIFEGCGALMTAIREHPVPVIAAVDGPAHAAGCELVASADIVVADELSATFATPGVRIGLFCHTPSVAIANALGGGAAGARRAALMLYSGKPVEARAAAEIGLVHEVARAGRALHAANEIAASIADASPTVIRRGKSVLRQTAHARSLDEAHRIARLAMVDGAMANQAAEGIRAFLDKRVPTWPADPSA